MTQEISSLMDGELHGQEAERAIRVCCASEEQKDTWHLYHVIGDSMRGQGARSLAQPTAVIQALKDQPTVLAPKRRLESTFARIALAAAASVATIGVVGWIGTQGGQAPGVLPVAKSGSAIQPVAVKSTVPAQGAPALDVQDYLTAHRQMPSPELYRQVNTNRTSAAAR